MHKQATKAEKPTEGMVDYDRNSSAQQNIVASQEAEIRRLVERLGPVEPEMQIVDYGCGPGTSAITAVEPAIAAYRAKVSNGPVVVCHADQPGNDWNALFKLVWGPSGYQARADGVRTEAAVGSFYDQLVAASSVDLGTCFTASQWLSHAVRLHSPGTIWFADLEGDARRQMAKLARRDWTRFLAVRARELRSGGFLLVSTLGSVPDKAEINGAAASGRGIYRALQVVAQGMADDGLIDQKVLDGFVFSLWFLTVEEARQPIEDDKFLSTAFAVETIEVTPAPRNPTDFFADLIPDPVAYATAYTGYTRAFADSTLRTQLFGPSSKDTTHENEIASEFYNRFNDLYRTHLTEFAYELWHLTVILRKR
jgi:SAM-dependent methyltransferase